MERTLRIRVDMREQASPVPGALAAFGDVELEFASLPSGDYVLSPEVVVERKEAGDFVASIVDRRLFGQAARMRIEHARPVLIVEGELGAVRSAVQPEAVRGALSYLVVIEGLSVLQTAGARETAALLRVMARHAQHGLGYEVSLRGAAPASGALLAEYLVEGLPGVGPRRARQLLEHFGTPAAVMAAAVEELMGVPGIGAKGARRIWDALHTPYPPRTE